MERQLDYGGNPQGKSNGYYRVKWLRKKKGTKRMNS